MTRLHPVISASAVALLVAACAGMSGRTAAPTTGPTAPAAPAPAAAAAAAMPADGLPAPVREILPNGLTLTIQDHRASDIVAVYLFIKVGLRYDRPDELGYSHFMEHMLFKGTDTWGPGYFDRAVEGVGGRSNAVTSFDYTTFQIVVPSEALETAVGLLRDQGA
jgi:zinc protease